MFDDSLILSRPVILIVDNTVSTVQDLGAALEEVGELLLAADASQALQIAQQRRLDLVVLNMGLPQSDGYALVEALRHQPYTAHAAYILVGPQDSIALAHTSPHKGGVDFLTTPIDIDTCRLKAISRLSLKRRCEDMARVRRDLGQLLQRLPALVAYLDGQGCVRYCNDAAGDWFGIPAANMLGQPLAKLVPAELLLALEQPLQRLGAGEPASLEVAMPRGPATLHAHISLVANAGGPLAGVLLLMVDISARKAADLARLQEKDGLAMALNCIGDAVIMTDARGLVSYVNTVAEQLTGWAEADSLGRPIEQVMPLLQAAGGAAMTNPVRLALRGQRIAGAAMSGVLQSRSGACRSVKDSAVPVLNQQGDVSGAIIVFQDISEARAMALKVTHLAHHDALTNLPNRLLLLDRVDRALQVARRNRTAIAVMLLDVDHFKFINDLVSHSAGDTLLQQVAARLQAQLRASDTISRQGGDEFVVLLPEIRSAEQAGLIAEKLLEAMRAPFHLGDARFNLTISIGISLFPDDSDDHETLLRHADVAMYRAKQDGRNRARFFSAELEDQVLSRHLLERHLRDAMASQRFEVFYQAKVNALDGSTVGVEALIRMRDGEGRLVSPAQFIPLAEETGLIVPIGKIVLERACQQAQQWRTQGREIKVSVNISALQFVDEDLLHTIASILDDTGLPAGLLELEITEGTLVEDAEAAQATLLALAQLGVTVSIDDFGTGYSSLAYLKRFSVHTLKIDQSFVREMLTDRSDRAIIQAIITLGQALGLKLVAEGVEHQQQADMLVSMGCHVMQGFLYSRPVPPAELDLDHGVVA
ncbi:EAL domain-containing protein [Chitinimonas sp.]|uniref:two-component system response regulator n=1 Tax=Chitinimonas sp. TaxID=1934313 RepID=UPI0035ADFFC8